MLVLGVTSCPLQRVLLPNATKCSKCPSGMQANAGQDGCVECVAGTASPHEGTTCQPCARGYESLDGVSCVECAVGTVASTRGTPQCEVCDAGTVAVDAR